MKKKIESILGAGFIVFNLCAVSAFAYTAPPANTTNGGASTQAEETQWYFRTHNGVLQKRLWSFTQGKWLTDWIDAYS